jgi:hypothetical protein
VALLPLEDPNLRLPGMAVIPLRTQRRRELGIVWTAGGADISGAALPPPVQGFLDFVIASRQQPR